MRDLVLVVNASIILPTFINLIIIKSKDEASAPTNYYRDVHCYIMLSHGYSILPCMDEFSYNTAPSSSKPLLYTSHMNRVLFV